MRPDKKLLSLSLEAGVGGEIFPPHGATPNWGEPRHTGTAMDMGWLSKQHRLHRQLEEKGADHIFIHANKNCSHPQLRVQMKINFSMWDFVLVT